MGGAMGGSGLCLLHGFMRKEQSVAVSPGLDDEEGGECPDVPGGGCHHCPGLGSHV